MRCLRIILLCLQSIYLTLIQGNCQIKSDFNFKKKYHYFFSTDKNSQSQISLSKFPETGEILSISSLVRQGSLVFMVDPIFNNVKCVNLNTGKLSYSQKFSSIEKLNDVIVWQNRVFISTDDSRIYVMNISLESLNSFDVALQSNENNIFLLFDGCLYVYSTTSSVHQRQDLTVEIVALKLSESGVIGNDTIKVGKGYNKYRELEKGFKNSHSLNCFNSHESTKCIDQKIPNSQYYCVRQVYVGANSITFFTIEKDSLILSSYDF